MPCTPRQRRRRELAVGVGEEIAHPLPVFEEGVVLQHQKRLQRFTLVVVADDVDDAHAVLCAPMLGDRGRQATGPADELGVLPREPHDAPASRLAYVCDYPD